MHNRLVREIVRRSNYRWGRISKRDEAAKYVGATIRDLLRRAYYAFRVLVQAERINKLENICSKRQLVAYSRNSDGSINHWLDKYFGEGTELIDSVIVEISACGTVNLWESKMIAGSYVQLVLPGLACRDYVLLLLKAIRVYKEAISQRSAYYAQVESFRIAIDYILKHFAPSSIAFPFEGQYWEQVICMMSRINGCKTYGVLHALNISCSLNSRLEFHNVLSPDHFISQSVYTSLFLQKFFGWPRHKACLKRLKGKYPLSRVIGVQNKIKDTSDANEILILGSYMLTEDLSAFRLLKLHFPGAVYYYKSHPLRRSDKEFMLSIHKHCEILLWDGEDSVVFDIILSPLSSTVSLELFLAGQENLLVYGLSNGCTPNPFEQFEIKLRTEAAADDAKLWSLESEQSVASIKEEICAHQPLEIGKLARCPK